MGGHRLSALLLCAAIWVTIGCEPEADVPPGGAIAVPSEQAPTLVPKRIVSLAPSLTEIALELGLGDRLVGVTTFCEGVPAEVARVATGLQVAAERVVALRPDYLMAIRTTAQAETLRALRELGIPSDVIPAESIADVRACVLHIAKRFGREAQAERHLRALDEVLESLPADGVSLATRPRVVFVVDWKPLFVAGRGSFVDEMLRAAGAQNAFGDHAAAYVPIDLEEVLARDPDFVLDVTLPSDGTLEGHDIWLRWQRLTQLRAVRSGNVHPFPSVKPALAIPTWVARLREILRTS